METIESKLDHELDAAEAKAWAALAGYKFWMFGYWAAWWVKLNQLHPGTPRRNPWREVVALARRRREHRT